MTEDYSTKTIVELAALIRSKAISPVELARAQLDRIAALDRHYHAFITITADHALSQARQAEAEIQAGHYRGPLHGIPFALKDIFNTAGIATTANSRVLQNNIPTSDAAVTTKLYDSGAVLLGKLATHEFAHGGPSYDLPWPLPRNPWNTAHFVGGSSSGSAAAIASGMIPASIGSDTGGSIRGPAALAGITGLKPTYGLVSRRGVIPNSYSFDHCGPMARNVEDCALLLQAIAGYDEADPASARQTIPDYRETLGDHIKGLRIGVIRHFWEEDVKADPAAHEHMDGALAVLRELGARVETIRLRPLQEYTDVRTLIAEIELFAVHHGNLMTRIDEFGSDLLRKMLPACLFQGVDYVQAQRQRSVMIGEFDALYKRFDVLITAGLGPAPRLDTMVNLDFWRRPNLLYPFSLAGGPALSVCNGFTASGLPLGMQIAAAPFNESTVLRVGHAYERATTWHARKPPQPSGQHESIPATISAQHQVVDTEVPANIIELVKAAARRAGLTLGAREISLMLEAAPYALEMAARIQRQHAYTVEPASVFRA